MKTYWIDECIVTPERKLLPRGFELHIGETARIVVPSDVPGDQESLYEEEIQLSQKTFAATYEDGTPVHIEDGETIGEEKERRITMKVFDTTEIGGKKLAILVDDESMKAYEAVEINGEWEIDFAYPCIGIDSADAAQNLDFEGAREAGYRFED